MPTAETILVFLAAALTLNVTPGPSIMYVMSRSLGQGRTAGLVSAVGLGTGSLGHAVAAALGLSVVLAYSPVNRWRLPPQNTWVRPISSISVSGC